MSSNDWTPPGESAADLWNERSILNGLFLGAVAFGVHLTLFIWCFWLLVSKRNKTRQDYSLLTYICLLFIFGNIGNATNIKFGQMTFIDYRNYPGGPNAYFVEQSINPIVVLCNSIYLVNSWLQDGLLLYRFWVFWRSSWYIVILPSLMFLTSFALSLILIIMLCRPGITLWSQISINLAIPYWSISIALNVLITLAIGARLLYMRRRLRNVLGRGGSDYVSVAAMLVESAILYSAGGLIFIITFAVNSPVQNLTLPVIGQTQSIAPLLIILRVIQGRAWSKETAGNLTTSGEGGMKFRNYSSTVIGGSSSKRSKSATVAMTSSSINDTTSKQLASSHSMEA